MSYATTDITEQLKAAREARRLSQRELSELAGVPQSHISKIESGSVDLRVSSLIALARALGLELKLIPRNALPAVNTIVRGSEGSTQKPGRSAATVQKALKRIDDTVTRLIREHPASKELAQIQNLARDLQRLRVPDAYSQTIQEADKALQSIRNPTASQGAIGKIISGFQQLRNALAHGFTESLQSEVVKPAYSLDESDNG
jgi:transcriptional regulator with XRE-family HTH domain